MTAVPPATRERTPYSVAARELLRETLLDAARDLVMERSWAEVTMNDIATAAGVSRQTLYSEFGSRAEFAQAFVLRESEMFLAAVEAAVNSRLDDPTAALAAALDVFMTAAEEHPLIRAVVSGDGTADGLLPFLTTQGKPVVQTASDRLAAVMRAGWPQASERDAALLADCLVRLAISYAALPSASAGITAKSVTTVLGPYIEQVVGDAS
jgi:AcrR family transcriptional regulator